MSDLPESQSVPAADLPELVRVPFALPDITEAEIAEVVDTLRSGWLTTGPKAKRFEQAFSAFLGEPGLHSLAVNSATAGLHLALEAIGIGPGDEVITTTHTFTATAEVVRYLGADVVLVDIDPRTLCIDPAAVESAVTPRSKAVLPVHFGGRAAAMPELLDVARRHGLKVVEDAAHALPTTCGGRLVGTLDSDVTVFSFYANKTITTGEGGMVVTRDAALAQRMAVMRLHGMSRDAFDRYRTTRPAWYYEIVAPGFKYNLTDIAAALGLRQLERAQALRDRRAAIAAAYDAGFQDLPVTLPPQAEAGDQHAWHLYVLRLADAAPCSRDQLIEALFAAGIACSVHYIPLHLQPYWRDRYRLDASDFPHSQHAYERSLSLPIYPSMSEAQVGRVVATVRAILGRETLTPGLRRGRRRDWVAVTKRLMDIAVSALGLLLLSPLLAAIALAIKLDSPGPVFFRQTRIGRNGAPFNIHKFRTMLHSPQSSGPELTIGADRRITRVGGWLRRSKLDELAQLIDVLRGAMSLVGPRPEVPRYVAHYPAALRATLLGVRPGLTDPAAIAYRDESELLARAADPEREYLQVVLPAKLALSVDYLAHASCLSDLRVMLQTLRVLAGR